MESTQTFYSYFDSDGRERLRIGILDQVDEGPGFNNQSVDHTPVKSMAVNRGADKQPWKRIGDNEQWSARFSEELKSEWSGLSEKQQKLLYDAFQEMVDDVFNLACELSER